MFGEIIIYNIYNINYIIKLYIIPTLTFNEIAYIKQNQIYTLLGVFKFEYFIYFISFFSTIGISGKVALSIKAKCSGNRLITLIIFNIGMTDCIKLKSASCFHH